MTAAIALDHVRFMPRELREAIAQDLMLLARIADREVDGELVAFLRGLDVGFWFALKLDGSVANEGMAVMRTALETLSSPPTGAELDGLAAEFARIFLTHGYSAAPNESVWRDDNGLERQEPMFEVRDWYRHYGLAAPNWRSRADDHLVHELEFLSLLLRHVDQPASLGDALRFLRAHPLVWVPAFGRRVIGRCDESFYAGSLLLLMAYLEALDQALAEATGLNPPLGVLKKDQPAARETGPDCGSPRYVPGVAPSW
ncbi:MAG: molecular chaperone TorD family protein [Hyphomicrobiaceae bacterium]|nr:molecular chaperone TorD family protein [Hyphomicrobiaceae bacterium]